MGKLKIESMNALLLGIGRTAEASLRSDLERELVFKLDPQAEWLSELDSQAGGLLAWRLRVPSPQAFEDFRKTILNQILPFQDRLLACAWIPQGLPHPKLVAFDMDSTFIQQEVIDEIGREINCYEAFAEITEKAMQGKLDFVQAFHERTRQLAGVESDRVNQILPRLSLQPGVESFLQFLKTHQAHTMIVSGGFDFVLEHFQKKLGISEIHAHHLLVDSEQRLTGNVRLPIIDAVQKQRLVRTRRDQLGIGPDQVIVCGDGANDILMMVEATCKVSIAGKPKLREVCNIWLFQPDYRLLSRILSQATLLQ